MKRNIIYGLLLIILLGTAFFIFQNIQFNNYTSSKAKNTTEEMNISINQDAPVKGHAEIVIEAPTEKIWKILTTINDWPAWQSEVTASELKVELKEGAEFKWKAGGLSFSSQIHTIEPQTGFGWTGKTFGASAIHNWFFKEERGQTLIRVEESLQGVFPKLFQKYFQKKLDGSVQKNLLELKEASER